MITPPRLQKGDKIGIVAPARSIAPEALKNCLDELKEWGLQPVKSPHLYEIADQYAGNDDQRRQDLQMMLDDPSIKAILSARGGYGTLRIIDGLSLKGIKKHPKWMIGFSDLTAFSMQLYNAGIENLHAPMGISWDGHTADRNAINYLRQALMAPEPLKYAYTPTRQDITRTGLGKGRVIGGNLSLLSQLLGTPTDFSTKGCILFFEDLSEYLYHIDRMIVHLKRAGKFENLAGLIVGGMTDMNDNAIPFGKTPEEIIYDAVKAYDFPVCYGFPTGHWPENYPMIIGRKAELRVSHTEVQLEFEPA